MTDLEKEIQELVAQERFEEAQALKNRHKPSKSISEAIIRWIDDKRTRRHEHKWNIEQRVWFWVSAGTTLIQQEPTTNTEGRLITYKCSCGEHKVIRTV